MNDPSARIEALESQLTFQEDALQQLSEALIAQQSRIDHLEAMLKMLGEQLGGGDDDSPAAPEPPPPHY
ncbi:MAG: SlyX family protein [Pseudomonadales bacterium]